MALLTVFLLTLTSTLATNAEQSLISGNNLFTSAVYRDVAASAKQNFLVSPFSAETVLAFAQCGAKGSTAQEIRTTLHLPDDQDQVKSEFKKLLSSLRVTDQDYSFNTANKLYIKKGYAIKTDFKSIATDVFYSDVENVDFTPSVEAAKAINGWVEKKTEDKIHDLVKPSALTAETVALIVNALYFKGNWTTQFKTFSTRKSDFYKIDKQVAQVDTMHGSDRQLNYFESQELDAKFLEVPFVGEDVSMTFVLPNDKDGISALESKIDKVFLPQNYSLEYVNVSLPKFKVESTLDFAQILKNLGVKKAFSPGEADFTGISDDRLVISDVIQKTFIDLNEYGVEAAASTFAEFVLFSAHFLPPNIKEFHAHHPFIYFIKIKGLVIFAGRVGAPSY